MAISAILIVKGVEEPVAFCIVNGTTTPTGTTAPTGTTGTNTIIPEIMCLQGLTMICCVVILSLWLILNYCTARIINILLGVPTFIMCACGFASLISFENFCSELADDFHVKYPNVGYTVVFDPSYPIMGNISCAFLGLVSLFCISKFTHHRQQEEEPIDNATTTITNGNTTFSTVVLPSMLPVVEETSTSNTTGDSAFHTTVNIEELRAPVHTPVHTPVMESDV